MKTTGNGVRCISLGLMLVSEFGNDSESDTLSQRDASIQLIPFLSILGLKWISIMTPLKVSLMIETPPAQHPENSTSMKNSQVANMQHNFVIKYINSKSSKCICLDRCCSHYPADNSCKGLTRKRSVSHQPCDFLEQQLQHSRNVCKKPFKTYNQDSCQKIIVLTRNQFLWHLTISTTIQPHHRVIDSYLILSKAQESNLFLPPEIPFSSESVWFVGNFVVFHFQLVIGNNGYFSMI